MNKDKHQAAIDALSELMRSELDGDMRGRFACVNRLAVLAQKLQIEINPRPEDMDEHEQDAYGINVVDHGIIRGGGAMHGGDQQQMAREMLAMIGPAMEAGHISRNCISCNHLREPRLSTCVRRP